MVLLLDETLTAISVPTASKIIIGVEIEKQGSSKNEEERECILKNRAREHGSV